MVPHLFIIISCNSGIRSVGVRCFFSGDFVNFKLMLRPAGCSEILQEIQGGRLKTQIFGGPPTTVCNTFNN